MWHLRSVSMLLLASVLVACNMDGGQDDEVGFGDLDGILYYAHAGDLYAFDADSQHINSIGSRQGRQGPFFSPDGDYFTSNNWPGGRELLALFELPFASPVAEYHFGAPVFRNDIGIRPSPGAEYFSAVAAGGTHGNFRVVNEQEQIVLEINQQGFRVRGHGWSPDGTLVLAGQLYLEEDNPMVLIYIEDVTDPEVTLIRELNTTFSNLPTNIAVSNDGSQIAYSLAGSIWMGSLGQGADDHGEVVYSNQSLARPVFSPDDTHLALVLLNSTTSMRGDIHVLTLPDNPPVRVEQWGPTRLPGPNNGGIWSSGEDSSLGWFDH